MKHEKHMSKKQNNKKQPRKQKGGKVLGQGRDGCVVDPVFKCPNTRIKNYNNKVSKLIDLTDNPEELIAFKEEFKIGQKFIKADPNHIKFLPGLEMCTLSEKNISKKQNKDLEDCDYNTTDYDNRINIVNIIMQKGVSFDNVVERLTPEQILTSIGYLCSTAIFYIHNMNITLVDIKPDNLLFSQFKNYIYPVFIDFSEDFVLEGTKGLKEFLTRGYERPYFVWPLEVNNLFRIKSKGDSSYAKAIEKFSQIKFSQINNKQLSDNMKYFVNSLKNEYDRKMISDKITTYMIGRSFLYVMENVPGFFTKPEYKYVRNILFLMTQPLIYERITLPQVITTLTDQYKIKNDFIIEKKNLSKQTLSMFDKTETNDIKSPKKVLKDSVSESIKIVRNLIKTDKKSKKLLKDSITGSIKSKKNTKDILSSYSSETPVSFSINLPTKSKRVMKKTPKIKDKSPPSSISSSESSEDMVLVRKSKGKIVKPKKTPKPKKKMGLFSRGKK
jgi:hypothetical protein